MALSNRPPLPVYIALLRAIGPATHAKMPMADLREGCVAAGLKDVATYINTGNVICRSAALAPTVRRKIAGVLARFGLANDVFIRTPAELQSVVKANPFPEAAAARPNHLVALFLHENPDAQLAAALSAHKGPEKIVCVGREVYVDYVEGVGKSKIAPGVIERRLKLSGTARNWNTVLTLEAMARAAGKAVSKRAGV
jgi:uncharacterized protein (DUF1697 family)